jgi:hypothetical protein
MGDGGLYGAPVFGKNVCPVFTGDRCSGVLNAKSLAAAAAAGATAGDAAAAGLGAAAAAAGATAGDAAASDGGCDASRGGFSGAVVPANMGCAAAGDAYAAYAVRGAIPPVTACTPAAAA